jgi:imidazole glycerol-phosphate synthase subunit HisH
MSSVAVIDYGMGNLHSIAKALLHVGGTAQVWVTADEKKILQADRVVFPGVGAIRDCMQALRRLGLEQVIEEVAGTKPLLGICLGLQALLDESEEGGGVACLGLFPGKVMRFAEPLSDAGGAILKIPHMGWNGVFQRTTHPLWNGISQGSRFYFVHSYYAEPAEEKDIAATSNYPQPFACALARDNIFAVQFHPEKSQSVGLRLLENFVAWDGMEPT